MSTPPPPRGRRGFKVAIICALPSEAGNVQSVFDKCWEDEGKQYGKAEGDQNAYTTGAIGRHNVVLAHMPGMGNTSASAVAAGLRSSFVGIQLALVVGICGVVPVHATTKDEIVLGDIIISTTVIQYDFGWQYLNGFERKHKVEDSLGRTSPEIRAFVNKLETGPNRKRLSNSLKLLVQSKDFQREVPAAKYPGVIRDRLYETSYIHQHRSGVACEKCNNNLETCSKSCDELKCEEEKLIIRNRHSFPEMQDLETMPGHTPSIHFGRFGSANTVMKSSVDRDRMAKADEVIAFEMESAGVWDQHPTVVIKAACDYADSHKDKNWQSYAAAMAAACMKVFLKEWIMPDPPPDEGVEHKLKVIDVVEVSQITEAIHAEKQSNLMTWLSSVNFWGVQDNILQRAQAGTGQWIFQDPSFKSWLAGEHRLLWCHGEAGAGKTVLSAIIIQHLSKSKKENEALAWIYVDYREHEKLTMENLLTNLLAQLFKQRGKISQSMIKSLGVNWQEAKPTLVQYQSWLRDEIRKFDRTIVIIDALDELPTRDLREQFICELRQLQPSIHLLMISRPSLEIRRFLNDVTEIEVRPSKDDVILFIKSRLENSLGLREHIERNASLSNLLIEILTQANDRMFLKAELILNVLEHIKTREEVEDALKSLPPTYDECYEFSLKQIEMQGPIQRDRAFKILAWLSFALEPLSVKAFQQALSIEPGDSELDESKQIPVDELTSVCHGLVIIETLKIGDVLTRNFRLLHETASKYLKKVRSDKFPAGHTIILRACLAYMSLPYFSNLRVSQIKVDERAREYPFYEYAAKNWPAHAIQGDLESAFQEPIINFLESAHRHSADEVMARHRRSAWGCEHATPWTDWNKLSINRRDSPLHAAATYGLSKTLALLLNNRGYRKDILNNFGETALQRAAQLGTTRAMDVLLAHGADLDAKVKHHYLNDANLLILATHCCQVDAVQVLLNHGISANTYDPKYLTFPLHLAASTHTKLTQLLLNYGATVDFPGKSPCYPETFMTSLHFAVFNAHVFNAAHERVNLLLDRGANIDSQSMTGNTPLHMALLGGHNDLVLLLLQRGANVELRNKQGKSALQLVRERGFFSSKEDSEPPKALSKLKDMPHLHSAVWSRDYPRVCELLGRGCDMEQKDQEGSTVWDYCIGRADIELAKLLVDYMEEQQLSRRKEIGNTAFETALKSMTAFDYTDHKTWEGSVKICEILLKYRKEFDNNLEFAKIRSSICEYNKTYLILAAENGRIAQVKFLLDCKADIDAVDRFGSTGMLYAVNNRDGQMIKLLVEHGSDLTLKDQNNRTLLDCAEMGHSQLIYDYLQLELAKRSR